MTFQSQGPPYLALCPHVYSDSVCSASVSMSGCVCVCVCVCGVLRVGTHLGSGSTVSPTEQTYHSRGSLEAQPGLLASRTITTVLKVHQKHLLSVAFITRIMIFFGNEMRRWMLINLLQSSCHYLCVRSFCGTKLSELHVSYT